MRVLGLITFSISLAIVGPALAAPAPTVSVMQQGEISRLVDVSSPDRKRRSNRRRAGFNGRRGLLVVSRAADAASPYVSILEYQNPPSSIRFTEIAANGRPALYRARIERRTRARRNSAWSVPVSPAKAKIVLDSGRPYSEEWNYLIPPGVSLCSPALSAKLFEATNALRVANRVPVLKPDLFLNQAARNHAVFMAQAKTMTHDGWFVRVFETGFSGYYVAQNIAKYISDPRQVVEAWHESPGHRNNQLNTKGASLGTACALDADGMIYWAQVFGT